MIVLYSTGCPKCQVLKEKLDVAGLEYIENTNMDEILEVANKINVDFVPILEVDNSYMNYNQSMTWINTKEEDK